MRKDMDKIVLESRNEVSLLQNVIEIAIATEDLNEDEKEIAKITSALLESMWYSW